MGYANLTAEIFAGLNDEWTAETTVGYIRVLGMNVHEYVHHPFFKNHDFVVFTNKTTGDRFAVDSSLYDYTGISEVRLANE